MAVRLLDVNLLMALAWPSHTHHASAHAWFALHRSQGWATCQHTQMGFLRLSMQPAVVKMMINFEDAMRALTTSIAAPEHTFWPQDYSLAGLLPDIRSRLMGHQQLADGMLLDLAIRRCGCLATFDQGVSRLLPTDPKYLPALEILH